MNDIWQFIADIPSPQWWGLGIGLVTVVVQILAGSGKTIAWKIALLGNALWFGYVFDVATWTLLPLVATMTVVYIRNWVLWARRDAKLADDFVNTVAYTLTGDAARDILKHWIRSIGASATPSGPHVDVQRHTIEIDIIVDEHADSETIMEHRRDLAKIFSSHVVNMICPVTGDSRHLLVQMMCELPATPTRKSLKETIWRRLPWSSSRPEPVTSSPSTP